MNKNKMTGAPWNRQACSLMNTVSCDASVSVCEKQNVDQVMRDHLTCEDEKKSKKRKKWRKS
jgi:hypothetical protein